MSDIGREMIIQNSMLLLKRKRTGWGWKIAETYRATNDELVYCLLKLRKSDTRRCIKGFLNVGDAVDSLRQ